MSSSIFNEENKKRTKQYHQMAILVESKQIKHQHTTNKSISSQTALVHKFNQEFKSAWTTDVK